MLERIEALEQKFKEQVAEYQAIIKDVYADLDTRIANVDTAVVRVESFFEKANEAALAHERNALANLDAAVKALVHSTSKEVVVKALRAALADTIVKVRPATREEVKSDADVVVTRSATPQEIRG